MNILTFTGIGAIGVLLGCTVFSAFATNSANVNFKGNLIVNPPCDLMAEDRGNTISVDFEDIVIRKMETKAANFNATSAAYQRKLPFILECDAEVGTAVRIQLQGDPASFNSEFLATDNANVGVQFINLGKGTFIPNNRTRRAQVIVGTPATFYVIPIRNVNVNDTDVRAGGFIATATLVAEYE